MDNNLKSVDLSKHFDKVVCINLPRRTDRWEQVSGEFSKWGITGVQQVAAVDGADLSPHLCISKGAYGLLLTTLHIICEAKHQGLKNVLILEDDVYFRETILSLDSYMNDVPADWDLLYLGGHHIQMPERVNDKIARVMQVFTTHSYAVNASVFDRIIQDLSDVASLAVQIDLYFSELQKEVKAYSFIPNMTGQRASFSDVENRYTDYTDNMDENLVFDAMSRKFLTVAIPTYEMEPNGAEFLRHSLLKLSEQTFRDFNVVISDHSKDDRIQKVVEELRVSCNLDIKYIRKDYETDNPSSNMNNAIRNSSGQYIKMLFQDDFLFDKQALQITVDTIMANPGAKWFASASEHSNDGINCYRPFYPRWNDEIKSGVNTISSPSVITIKNVPDKIFFDLDLIWLMDCDYYHRANERFGHPVIINHITVVNRTWRNQLTNLLSDERKSSEVNGVKEKYKLIGI